MKEELELQLVQKYPELFVDYKGDKKTTCMAWGCAHGDGWYNLLDDLCSYLQYISSTKPFILYKSEHKKEEGTFSERNGTYINLPPVCFAQIKEKFAGLRVYTKFSSYSDEAFDGHGKLDESSFDYAIERYQNQIQYALEYVEFLSRRTCEFCGKPGRVYADGWYKTYCSECAKMHGRSTEATDPLVIL